MPNKFSLLAICGTLFVFGAGCGGGTPAAKAPGAPVKARTDYSATKCEDIEAARKKVLRAYEDSIKTAGERYADAKTSFQGELTSCLKGLWKGGPCDNEWDAVQAAYASAWKDVSNEAAYQGYKKAKQAWDKCSGNPQNSADWKKSNQDKQQACNDEFSAKKDAAEKVYVDALNAAKAERDADMAKIAEVEKKCKEKSKAAEEPKPQIPGMPEPPPAYVPMPEGSPFVTDPRITPNDPECKEKKEAEHESVAKEIATELAVRVAEEITGTPLPVSAIDHKIFAGVVCVKLRARLIELQNEEIMAVGGNNRGKEIRLRRQIAQYSRALSEWCRIAEGKMTAKEAKAESKAINQLPSGECPKSALPGQGSQMRIETHATWSITTGK